uniref:Pleurain-a1-thel n=1 Tax=Theloderma corticale TaxID=126966 RepID=R4QZ32_THECO|nr:pleurain-a1-thel precursor [Theloderma corticale]
MFTLKKSLFLLTFLGVISISLCKRENDDDEDTTEDLEEEEKKKRILTMTKRVKMPQLYKQIVCRLFKTC